MEAEAPKVKKGRGKGKIAETKQTSDMVALKEEGSDHDVAPPSPTKKRPTRKTAGLQKLESESEEDGTAPESDTFELKTKSHKARKKLNDPDAVVK